jgi:homogentisate 1,2-dioxygenase
MGVLKLYIELQKVESLQAIQLRMGTNSLDAFLFQARVPSVHSLLYSGDGRQQTVKHVLIFRPRYASTQHELRDEQGHLPDISQLLGTTDGLHKTTKLVI